MGLDLPALRLLGESAFMRGYFDTRGSKPRLTAVNLGFALSRNGVIFQGIAACAAEGNAAAANAAHVGCLALGLASRDTLWRNRKCDGD